MVEETDLMTDMVADMVKNLALLIMERNCELNMEQALSLVFNSDTYQKILNKRAHLYYQSPRYIFALLNEELTRGKFE